MSTLETAHSITLAREDGSELTIEMIVGNNRFYVNRVSTADKTGYGERFDHQSDCAQEFYAQIGEAIVLDGYRVKEVMK